MTDNMIDKLSNIDLATVVILIVLVSMIVSFLSPWMLKLRDLIIKKHKKEVDEQDFKTNFETLEKNVKNYIDKYQSVKESSNKIHEELNKSIKSLDSKLENFREEILNIKELEEERNKKRVRAELKDKISKSYRAYQDRKEIYDIELESLKDLIQEYEDAGGNNSFVHSVVEKEMYTWNVITKK